MSTTGHPPPESTTKSWGLARDDYTSALTTTTLPHGRGIYDMLIRGEEGHGDACNRSASKEVIYGVSVLLSLFQVVLGIAVLIGIVIGIIKFIDRKNPSSPKVTDDTAKTSTKAIED